MKEYRYKTRGTCSSEILFSLDDEKKIHDLKFIGGCNGNLKGIGLLCEGKDAKEIADLLEGNTCGFKNTSCPDQLSKALKEALNN